MKTPETSKKATKIKQKTKITPGGNIMVWYLLLELLIWNISIERRKGKERRKERREEERKKERKEEFFEGGEFIPLKYCFFNCVCFPVAYFQTSSKSNFAFHSGANKLKAKPKNKKQKSKNKKNFFLIESCTCELKK